MLVEKGPADVGELLDWGARFDRDADGTPALGREAAHSVRRVLHAGDATGREIGRVAVGARRGAAIGRRRSTMRSSPSCIVEDGRVAGVTILRRGGAASATSRGRATLLATGGAGQVFRETTNPAVATGDGIALAYHAGARVADLEFVQFHPTASNIVGRAAVPDFRSASRRRRAAGERPRRGVHDRYTRTATGAARRRGAQHRPRVERGPAAHGVPDARASEPDYVTRRFPTIAAMCLQVGLDLARDPIPVGPAAHYIMGGVDTDEWGRTSLPGLFAAGEVACTGVHGANRLASNSLLEGWCSAPAPAAAMQSRRGGAAEARSRQRSGLTKAPG